MMPRLAASSAQFLRSLLRFGILLPLILVLPQFSSGEVYQEEAFVPVLAEGGGDMVTSPMGEAWQVVYQTDFSTDPGWTTNSPDEFYWKEADGTYYFKRTNGAEQYSFKSIPFDPEVSYRLEFDVYMMRCDWAADHFLGLGDSDMSIQTATTWLVSYHKVDQGQTAALIFYDSDGNYSHPGGSQPAPFQLNTWYHNVATYDPTAGTLSLQVTKVSDGSLVGQVDLGAVGSFTGVDRLYMSSVGHVYAPGATAEGYIDNLVLKKYSPAAEDVIYQTDFSTDPQWITDQPSNHYWNQTALTYHAKVENNAPAYSPNRYFYKAVTGTADSFEIQWDIKMTRADWSAGVSFGLFDENIAFAGWGGGQGVCLEFANPDAGRLLWLYIYGGGGLASASSPGGSYAVNTSYTCKLSYDAASGRIYAELHVRDSGSLVWSKVLAVPGGFSVPLVKLGGSRSGFGETGYGGVNRWGVAEAEIDNVVFKRAGVGPVAPVVTQFAINGGAATTESRLVTLNNTTTNSPTHCMASESSSFTGAAWQTYSAAPQFILSAGDGEKTVYFKTKNAVGESNVVSDAITLQQAAVLYKLSAFLPARACYSADVSPDGNIIYAAVSLGSWDEGVRLYDAHTYEHIKDIHSFPNVPKYILASADGIHLYATAYYQGTVVKVRVADGAVVKSIAVGPWPVGMVFDSARRYLYVMVNCPYPGAVGSISIIDTSTDTVVGTIGPIVHAGTVLAISPDDQFLYALSFDYAGSEPQTLYKMTIADRSVQAVPGVQVGGISVSPDGQLLYVADRFAGSVRVFQTSSMTETTSIPIADVHSFWVAPSGDRALAVCLAPGSTELLIRVVGLPRGEILQTLSQTLELPDGLSSYPLVDPIFWNRTTGEAFIPIFREHGGVIVISPAGEAGQVVYQTDFSSDPGWVTDQAANYYWNQTAGTYHAKVENNAPGYRPNRYFYKAVTWTGDSLEVEWDVKITRMDWSGGVCFGLFDEDIALGGFEGGQGVQLLFGHPDEGLVLAFYATGATGLAQVDSKAGPRYSTNVWYTCKICSDAAAGEVSVEVKDRSSGSSVWSKSLSVPGRFSRPLVRLGGSWSGFGETGGGYSGVNRWAVAEAEIDNVVFKRAGVGPLAPVVTQFAINSGAATTQSRTATLNNTTENDPTHYMASESSGLSGATWQIYSTAPQFILSEGDGQKTVYFKTKNEAGESNVVSDTIQLITSVPAGPEITTTSLPDGVEGRPYSQVFQVSGGVSPYTWSIATGKLPDGLSLDPNTGVISGTPRNSAIGTSTFIVRVTDSQSGADTIYVFGGQRDYSVVLSSVEKYDPVADVWTFVSPMNEQRVTMGFCTDDQGRFYAIAGQSAGELRTVERYDPARDVWEYLAPLPLAVGGPAAFTFNGEVYAVGGWMPGYTNRCFIYSPDTDTWREGPSVYETFGHAGPVISLSGVPYLIGGHLDTPSWSIRSAVSMLVREGADLVWKPSTPLQRRRQGVGVTLGLDGLIYAIGGDEKPGSSGHVTTETVERFSEATKAWEYVRPMPGKRAFAGAVTDSSGCIWAVGGTDWTLPFFDSVLRYDPCTDSWTTMTSRLNTGRIGHGIAIIRGERQTDEQELSITILPQGPWQVVYSSDFSTDPNWTTNDPSNLSWESATETFHGWQSNADGTHAYTPVELMSGISFRLEFDVRINSIEWSAGLTFGLFDSRLMYNAGAVIEYGYYDVGYTIALSAGNPSGPPDWDVVNWETGVWYRNVIEYDAESKVVTLEVRRRDNDALICQLSLSGISSFPPGMVLLGASRIHMAGYNNAAVDFNLDNVVLEEFYQPPKREVEILPLGGPLLRISWDSEVGKEYQLWATSDLSSGEWIPVGPRMGGTGGKLYIDDYIEGLGNRFYRVEIISSSAPSPEYAVVVSESTAAVEGWDHVVSALVSRHAAPVIPYSGSPFPAAVRDELAAFHPRYVCFVAQPTEVTDAFVINVHELTRQLDDDPFGDCIWGIITGARAEDAMRLASASSPLEIQRGLLKAGGFLEWLPAGVFHSESDNATMWVKELGGEIEKRTDGPLDDTESLVAGLNSGDYQLFVTSGHASEYNWQLHWPDADGEGFFFSDNGQLYAIDHNGTRHDIVNSRPLVYWAPGNCLIGRMAGADSMALGWLGSGRAVQFCGYIVPTWYGYMGWGLNDYFLKLQDRFSFAEASFLTNQALIFDQLHETPGTDSEGLAYDKNAVVFYGDPALKAIVSPCRDPLYNQSLEATAMPSPGQFRVVLTITMNENAEVPRPVVAFLPFRVVPSETILEQSQAQAVEITDDMVLAQIWVQGEPALSAGEEVRVTFTCVRAS